MKKIVIFIIGIITGIALTILVSALIVNSRNDGITMFDEPGDYIEGGLFEIFQVIAPSAALAHLVDHHSCPVVLLINDQEEYYYDDQIIDIPRGKAARQIGVYRYDTELGYKTVPIVEILE